jgi:DDE superfamily endonuclease/Helix-turn-helix of DDE superfamily endonuclease
LFSIDVIGNREYNERMVTYKTLQNDRRQFLALTGLTLPEFQLLLTAFTRASQRLYPTDQTAEGQPRRRSTGGGCKGLLRRPEDKLLFILVYLKTYPLQVVMSELFELSQPQVNYWIHRLLPILQEALDDLGDCPERNAGHFAQSQTSADPEPRLIIDGTERRRQRPKNPEKQALHYSGKKKTHCDKNIVIVSLPGKRIDFLSHTYVGKTHDKKIADTEGIAYPPEAILYKDTGFQGYEPAVQETRQAKKTPPRGELTAAEKRTNRKLARIRVQVEHALSGVKRCRIVKDVLRNTKEGVSDNVMEAACGLHNLRVQYRKRRLKR